MNDTLLLRRILVEAGVLVYWIGVVVQARRIRRRIGRSPNLRPRNSRERLLWLGWSLVVVGWAAQPFLAGVSALPAWLQVSPNLLQTPGLILGVALSAAGYAGTLWCYASMGDAWRIGIDRRERNPLVTSGPYRFVRHPIYLFQVVMLAGALALLPSLISAAVLVLHLLCAAAKASDEETFLRTLHGRGYDDYAAGTGRLFPRWNLKRSAAE